jgi:ribosomal-protein-alanine N-acetyltransferase
MMNVRNLTPEHLQACLGLDRASLGGLWSAAQWQTELADPRRPGMGIWQADTLLAMASGWLVVDELHITLVAVAPGQRRQGLGRQVLEALFGHARQQGARHATLEVAATNAAAVGLYRSLGFQDAGLRRGYYRNGDDALIQWLRLPPINDAEPGCG